MKIIPTLTFLILVSLDAFAQGDSVRNIFVSDLDFFIEKLEETHPDPYSAYGGRVGFHRRKQALRDELKGETDTTVFVRKLRAFLAPMKDAHTWISNPSSPSAGKVKYLPIEIGVSTEGLYILDADAENKELTGSLITEIGGIGTEELADRMSRMSAAENRYGNYRNLANQLGGDIYAGRLLGYVKDTLEMVVCRDGRIRRTEIVYRDTPFEKKREGFAGTGNPILYTRLFPDAGYIRWNSVQSRELIEGNRRSGYGTDFLFQWAFSYLEEERTGDDEADAEKIPYLYKTVADLLREMGAEGIDNLIIDLRTNGGGMTPLVYPLMRMLYGDDFLRKKFDAVSGVRLSPMLLAKRGYENIDSYNSRNGTDFVEGDISFDDFAPNGILPLTELREMPLYRGYGGAGEEWVLEGERLPGPSQVYVLVSPSTFSAAYHFLYMLTEMGAISIGVTPAQAGNTFMESTELFLPGTGLRGSVSNSWQGIYPDNPVKGEELTPDHPMTIAEYERFGFDPDAEVLKALELIRER